jgi:thioredoxin:protein disulfide reductase
MKTTAFVWPILTALLFSLFASSEESAKFKILNSEIYSSAGKSVQIQIETKLPKGFHIYADQLKLQKIEPANYQTGQIQISPQTEFYDKHSQQNRAGFSDHGKILFQIESPEKTLDNQNLAEQQKIQFELRYQICSEQICYLPKNEKLELNLIYKAAAVTATGPKAEGLFANLDSELSKNIYWAFVLVFLAGILTSFTPCIFPMIPITLSVLGHDANKNTRLQNFLKSLVYVHGIALTYSILGVIAAMTGSLFGQALANKYVLSGIVILFVLMAFGMWGFYDLQMPAFIRNKFGGTNKSSSESYLGIFIMGLFAGVVASPCVGPVLVSILSFVSTTKNIFLGFGLLFTYAMGLGLIFIVIGLFSQFLKLLPRSGAWMNFVKFIMGFLMICMAVYYLNFIVPVFSFFNLQSQTVTTESSENKNSDLKWVPFSEENLKNAVQNHRPVMIDFFAEWCGACHELQDKTFSVSEFKQMSKDFDLLTVDATEDKAEIQKILTKYNVKGLPTVIFVNRKGTVLNELTFTQFLEWNELKPKLQKALESLE